MNTVVDQMLLLTPATGAVIELVDDDHLVYKAASGSVAPYLNTRLKKSASLSGLCVKDREIKITKDTSSDPRVDYDACKKVGAASMVVVPLFRDQESVGVLKVVSNKTSAFSEDDLATLQLMATLLGAALGQQLEVDRRRKLEEILMLKTQELESRNVQLEEVLAELETKSGELEIKNVQVNEAAHRISEFTSTLSHELRTPLTSISGALRLIEAGRAGELSPQASSLVNIAYSESERLIRLVNDILDLGKIEEGKFELKLAEVAVPDLIAPAVNAVQGLINERSIKLEQQILSDAILRCDPDRIVQTLVNFLSNAIKFSPDHCSVIIKISNVSNSITKFEIIDFGCGIPGDQIPKLFARFQQVDSSNNREKTGSGLGLAISKSIIEQHGGRIGVHSKPESGSTFWFELPSS